MKNLVNGMMNIFKNSSDWSTFEQILNDNNIDNLCDFLKIKGIYHYVKTIYFRDNRVKTRHPSEYYGEKIQFKWSDKI